MKILIACECSGVTVKAFQNKGHEVISCDLLPAIDDCYWQHYQGDVRLMLDGKWDMIVAYPPLNNPQLMQAIAEAPAHKIAIENPPIYLPDCGVRQIFKPFPGMRCSALWLKNLAPLIERNMTHGAVHKFIHEPIENKDLTDAWLASAMATQWLQ